jgi:ribonuclease P protein component
MLQKSNRLNLKTDFKWIRMGKEINTRFCRMCIRLGDNTSARLGIASSSKTFPKAVDRNRARRVISAAFEVLYSDLPENLNILALPKLAILDVKSGDVLIEIEGALRQLKVLNEDSNS